MVKLNVEGTELETEPRLPTPPEPAELIGRVPRVVAKPNGPTPKDPRSTAERGLLEFDIMTADRDRLERELKEAREKIKMLEIQLEQLEGTRNTIESRISSCVLERDQAVAAAGELRGALNSVAAICVRYHDAQQQD